MPASAEEAEPFPQHKLVCKDDAAFFITVGMASKTSKAMSKYRALPYFPYKECEWFKTTEINLNEIFELPDEPTMFNFVSMVFRDGSRTKLIIMPDTPWAVQAKKDKWIEHFYEDYIEDTIAVDDKGDNSCSRKVMKAKKEKEDRIFL